MNTSLFTHTGEKKGTVDLPATLFSAPINWGLMHQAVLMQQGNRRNAVAHVKTRGEVAGSTKKLFQQKHTGQARRGSIRSPLLRGGGKTFGPRNDANFTRSMPRKMRHAALRSCLSLQAEKQAVIVVESYPDEIKTKTMTALLKKLPVEMGRRILLVAPAKHEGLRLSSRNIAGVKMVYAAYLNAEDILNSRHVIFLKDAIAKAEEIFGKQDVRKEEKKAKEVAAEAPAKAARHKKSTKISNKTPKKAKKAASKKAS